VETFLERVPEHVLVVFDEAYFEFVDDPQFPDTIRYIHRRIPNIMLLRTLSKTYGLAGLRIGYGLGPPEVLAPLFVVKGSFSVNLLAQAGGIAALEDQEFLHQTVHQTRINRAALTAAFEEMELQVVPSQTNFILVWVGKNATEVYTELMKQGVIVRPCVQYELPEFLRITVGTTDHNARLIASMKRVLGR
jgi:histidinol-phosphate aminotransferase